MKESLNYVNLLFAHGCVYSYIGWADEMQTFGVESGNV
jgi:hypothetical protein